MKKLKNKGKLLFLKQLNKAAKAAKVDRIRKITIKNSDMAIDILGKGAAFTMAPFYGKKIEAYNICTCRDISVGKVASNIMRKTNRGVMLAIGLSGGLKNDKLILNIANFLHRVEKKLGIKPSKIYSINGEFRVFAIKPSSIWISRPVLFSMFMLIARSGMFVRVTSDVHNGVKTLLKQATKIDDLYLNIEEEDEIPEGMEESLDQFRSISGLFKILTSKGIKKVFRTKFSKGCWNYANRDSYSNGIVACATGEEDDDEDDIAPIKYTFTDKIIKQSRALNLEYRFQVCGMVSEGKIKC